MRFSFVALLAIAGCGSNGNNMQDMTMSGSDMTVENDMTVKTTCSLTAQDCGTGMKCVIQLSQSGPTTGKCVDASKSNKAEGASCTYDTSNMNLFNDDCVAGLTCDSTGTGDDAVRLCRKYCAKDADCTTSGQRCLGFDTGVGWCVPTCTPFSSSCTTGDCGSFSFDITATMMNVTGFFVCKHTGAGAINANCMSDSDCGSGLYCDSLFQGSTNTCLPLCDGTAHMCPAEPGDAGFTLSCQAFTDQSGKGFCSAM